MAWLSSIIAKVSNSQNQLSLKFSKDDNTWLVMKEYSILFMGDQTQCSAYIKNYAGR